MTRNISQTSLKDNIIALEFKEDDNVEHIRKTINEYFLKILNNVNDIQSCAKTLSDKLASRAGKITC